MKNIQEKKHLKVSLALIYGFIIVFTIFAPASFIQACGRPGEVPCTTTDNRTNSPSTTTNNLPTSKTSTNTTGNTEVTINTGIKNPLGDKYPDIPSFIVAIIDFVLVIGVPIVTLAIIYCGFLFVTGAGNSEKLTKAKKALLYTLIGAALLLGSFVISKAIVGTVEEIKSTT